MGELWNTIIPNLQMILALLTQLFGGNLGLAIITLSFTVRSMLLPLTLRIAEATQKRQRILQSLQPELDHLKRRYAEHPDRLAKATFELYRAKGVRLFDIRALGGGLLQLPIAVALYSAIRNGLGIGKRFFWIRDLTQPDLLLGILVSFLTFLVVLLSPSSQPHAKMLTVLVPSLLTFMFVSQMSAGIGLYWATSNLVGVIQSLLLRHRTIVREHC